MLKANVDKIIDILKEKKSVSVRDLSRQLNLPSDDLQKSAEYLEEDGVVKIEHKFPNVIVTLVKEPEATEVQPQHPLQQKSENFNPQKPQPQVILRETKIVQAAEQRPAFILGSGPFQPPMQSSEQTQPVQQFGPAQQAIQETNETSFHQASFNDKNPTMPQEETNLGEKNDFFSEQRKPMFDMAAPMPKGSENMKQDIMPQTSFFSEDRQNVSFPEYASSSIDRIEFLIEKGHKKITNHDYKDLNIMYRQIFTMFKESDELSPNERYLLAEKINDLFTRIKRIYIIEGNV